MHKLYKNWHELLDQHSQLLSELEKGLQKERKALLASDIILLREASLFKDNATRKVVQIREQIDQYKQKTEKELGIKQTNSLYEIFLNFETTQQNTLLEKRRDLMRQSKTIDRINKFNNKCLDTYIDFVDGIRSIFSMCKADTCQTYSSNGLANNNDNIGRLIDRSL